MTSRHRSSPKIRGTLRDRPSAMSLSIAGMPAAVAGTLMYTLGARGGHPYPRSPAPCGCRECRRGPLISGFVGESACPVSCSVSPDRWSREVGGAIGPRRGPRDHRATAPTRSAAPERRSTGSDRRRPLAAGRRCPGPAGATARCIPADPLRRTHPRVPLRRMTSHHVISGTHRVSSLAQFDRQRRASATRCR